MALPKFDHPWVNEIHTPIYIVHGPDHPTDEEVQGYVKRLDEWTLIAHDPYSWVVFPVHLTPSQRKLMADAQARRRIHMIKNQRSLAFVVTNPIVRGVLNAVFWFSPPPIDYRVFADFGEAYVWVAQAHHITKESSYLPERDRPPVRSTASRDAP